MRGPVLGVARLFRTARTPGVVDGAVHGLGSGTLALSGLMRVVAEVVRSTTTRSPSASAPWC